MEDEQGLMSGELIKAPSASNIVNAYQFKGGIIRPAAPMAFAGRLERGEQGLEFRENSPAYLGKLIGNYKMSLTKVPGW